MSLPMGVRAPATMTDGVDAADMGEASSSDGG